MFRLTGLFFRCVGRERTAVFLAHVFLACFGGLVCLKGEEKLRPICARPPARPKRRFEFTHLQATWELRRNRLVEGSNSVSVVYYLLTMYFRSSPSKSLSQNEVGWQQRV